MSVPILYMCTINYYTKAYYYPQSTTTVAVQPDWDGMERVQVSLRGELYDEGNKTNRGIVVEKIVLGY